MRRLALLLSLLPVSAFAEEAPAGYKLYDHNRLQSIKLTVLEPDNAKCIASQNKQVIEEVSIYPAVIYFYPNQGKLRIDCSAEGYNSTFTEGSIEGYIPENAKPEEISIRLYPKGKKITPYSDQFYPQLKKN